MASLKQRNLVEYCIISYLLHLTSGEVFLSLFNIFNNFWNIYLSIYLIFLKYFEFWIRGGLKVKCKALNLRLRISGNRGTAACKLGQIYFHSALIPDRRLYLNRHLMCNPIEFGPICDIGPNIGWRLLGHWKLYCSFTFRAGKVERKDGPKISKNKQTLVIKLEFFYKN